MELKILGRCCSLSHRMEVSLITEQGHWQSLISPELLEITSITSALEVISFSTFLLLLIQSLVPAASILKWVMFFPNLPLNQRDTQQWVFNKTCCYE
jgi:hypothetical protein